MTTIQIDIASDVEAQLEQQAIGSGASVPVYVQRLVERSVRGPRRRGTAVLSVLDSFMRQDEQEHRETLATLRNALEADRPGQRRVFGEGINPKPASTQ